MQFQQYIPQFWQATILTIELMSLSLFIGFCLSIVMTLCRVSGKFYLKFPVEAFVFFIRGTPLLVQIFIIYYGSGQFEWLRTSFLWVLFKEPFGCAIIALSLNTCAYTTELFYGAIHSIPKGEIQAGRALGMSHALLLRRIILPRALRIALPAYSNEVIMVLKSTSLASTITLLELTGMTRQIVSATYEAIPFFLFAGAIYLILNGLIIGSFRMIEKRLHVII